MDGDRLDTYDRLARYERYLRYMHVMDSMDMMEGVCDISLNEMIQRKNSNKKSNAASNTKHSTEPEISTDEEEPSDENFESNDEEDSYSDDSLTLEPPKKKIDLENPYRGLKDTGNPLETMDDYDFLNSYKFSKKTIYDIMELIKNGLIKHTNRGSPVPPLIELLITLKYLTTGSVQNKTMSGVSQSTISRINTRVTKLIVALQNQFIKFPDRIEVDKNKARFYERGKFPDVVGCIGSTHVGVRVKGVKDYNIGFINENGYHSVRIQVHQLMLKDDPRMETYKTAIMNNKDHIAGKTVMDVGAGSGILSIFCAMAGANKVYAVEASNIANVAKNIVKENNFENIIEVIHSKVEDITLPNDELVDIIVSEWMGFYLLHEGMLDSVIYARDKFLKPDGHMFPESATIYMAPCGVPAMYETWNDVHGVNMKSFGSALRKYKSHKPEVLKIEDADILAEKTVFCWIDLKYSSVRDLDSFTEKVVIGCTKNGRYQGICIWFDCLFPVMSEDFNEQQIILSTSPADVTTHWKQTVIVLPEEQDVEIGTPLAWELSMKRSEDNNRRYSLELTLLDAYNEVHPSPCNCHLTKCIVIAKFLEEH